MHFVTRETGYTQHPPRQGNKGMGVHVSPSPTVPSKVVVNVPLESTKRYAGINEGKGQTWEREGIFITVLESQKYTTTIRRRK